MGAPATKTIVVICRQSGALVDDHNPCGDFSYAVPGANGTVLSVHRQRTLVLSALKDWSPVHVSR